MYNTRKHKPQAKWQGIFVLAITPFQPDGTLDLTGLAENIETFLAEGAHGVIVGGTYAEYPSMSRQERLSLFAAAGEAVAGRVPFVCCTAASGTREAVELSREARTAGADGVMVTPPYVAEVRQADVLAHFRQVAEEADVPVMIYNSTSIGLNLTPEQLVEVAALPGVVSVKQANTDLHAQVRTRALCSDEFSLFCGSDGVALGSLALGFDGITSTLANVLTKDYVHLYRLVGEGRLDPARQLFYSWQPLRDFFRKHGQPAGIKLAMAHAGRKAGPVRAPFRPLEEAAEREYADIWSRYLERREALVSL
ncbi:dihydrodipicolinate synthase family protein [Paenibacillus sp. S150]|uniref:dihydrodipicolinate synthase family protein n=1 Tax=Paenibacillus sp. S150 TaxID=2749826 RepID=UPI001C58FDAC|nr:dihydrodipicolinate synthase family protein [Paenibacillus sp. S150]MBW4081996.1 dihydrodipicolinate synthase family protein [Paenibacillus sp. S150]